MEQLNQKLEFIILSSKARDVLVLKPQEDLNGLSVPESPGLFHFLRRSLPSGRCSRLHWRFVSAASTSLCRIRVSASGQL